MAKRLIATASYRSPVSAGGGPGTEFIDTGETHQLIVGHRLALPDVQVEASATEPVPASGKGTASLRAGGLRLWVKELDPQRPSDPISRIWGYVFNPRG